MKVFLITAGTLSGNKGSESMFTAVYQNLRRLYPGSRFYFLSYYPKADRQIVKNSDIEILSGTPLNLLLVATPLSAVFRLFSDSRISTRLIEKNPVIKAIKRADLVIDIGGITFSDGREMYLPFNIVTILPALMMRKRVIKCAQAMGPFNRFLNRVCAKRILPKLELIFARGKTTADHLKTLGLRNAIQVSDVAFSMRVDDVDTQRIRKRFYPATDRVVGIAPSSVLYKYCRKRNIDYSDILARFCDSVALKRQFKIVLIPHSIRKHTDRLKNNDLPVIKQIMRSVKCRDHVESIDDDLTASELRSVMQQCDFFIASRFHSMISALSEKIPTIVCGWGHKYLEVMREFDLAEYTIDYIDLSHETLLSVFEKLHDAETDVRKNIDWKLPEIKRNADIQFEQIKRIIGRDE